MEGNWMTTQSSAAEASMASSIDTSSAGAGGDWRSQLQTEDRQRIINRTVETLKRHLPISVPEGLNELRKIAIRFEEKVYTAATSQPDYLRKISLKMISMETKNPPAAPINPGMPNPAAVDQNPIDPGSVGMQSHPNNPGQPLPVPNRQSILRQNIQNSTSAAVQGASGMAPKLQHSSLLQHPQQLGYQSVPSLLQNPSISGQQQVQSLHQQASSAQQQSTPIPQQSTLSHQQQMMGQQGNLSNMQQNQLLGQQNNIADIQQQQQRLPVQQNNLLRVQHQQLMNQHTLNLQQQQLGSQSNMSGLFPSVSNMQPHQQALMMQKNASQQQQQQQQQQQNQQSSLLLQSQGPQSQNQSSQQQLMSQYQSQPSQLQQQLLMPQQSNSLQQEMQRRLQSSGPILQTQNAMEQKSFIQAPTTSVESTAQTGHAGTIDWQEECYQKVKSMKELYFAELTVFHQKIALTLQQQAALITPGELSEQHEKLKCFRQMLGRMLSLLQINKNNIPVGLKERLPLYEKQILSMVASNRAKKMSPQAQGQQQFQLRNAGNAHPIPQQRQSQVSQLQLPDNNSNQRVKVSEPAPAQAVQEEPTFSCPAVQEEPTFNCPICMSPLVSPFTTVCGHIFCEDCIKTATKKQKKCPTCRSKLTGRNNIHRVFLPTNDRDDLN